MMPTPEIVWAGQAYDLIRPLWITVNKLETAGELWRRAENLAHAFVEQPWRIVCIDADHAIREFRGWVPRRLIMKEPGGSPSLVAFRTPMPLAGPILAPASDLGEAWPAFVAELIGGG